MEIQPLAMEKIKKTCVNIAEKTLEIALFGKLGLSIF